MRRRPSLALVAGLVILGPAPGRAQAPMARAALSRTSVLASPRAGAAPSAEVEGHRRTLLAEIEDWKPLLPETTPPEPAIARHRSALLAIQDAASKAGTEPELGAARERFEVWKRVLAADLYPGAEAMAETMKNTMAIIRGLNALAADDADKRMLEGLKSQAAAAPMDSGSLARLFENIGRFGPSARGPRLVSPGEAPQAPESASAAPTRRQDPYARLPEKGLRIREVPGVVPDGLPFVPNTRLGRLIVETVFREARRQGIDPLLVLAVIKAESDFNPNARSRVWDKRQRRWVPGAIGLMQIMPATGRGMGYSPSSLWDLGTNIRAGISYLKDMWDRFVGYTVAQARSVDPSQNQRVKKAVAAYNAGPGAVERYGGIPPYRETRGYVIKVLTYYSQFQRHYDRLASSRTVEI